MYEVCLEAISLRFTNPRHRNIGNRAARNRHLQGRSGYTARGVDDQHAEAKFTVPDVPLGGQRRRDDLQTFCWGWGPRASSKDHISYVGLQSAARRFIEPIAE